MSAVSRVAAAGQMLRTYVSRSLALQTVLANTVAQSLAGGPQQSGSRGHVIAMLLQRGGDDLLVHFIQRHAAVKVNYDFIFAKIVHFLLHSSWV